MTEPINNDSVLLTIAEIRFNTIFNMPDYIALIQDGFRLANYPGYVHLRNKGFQLAEPDSTKSMAPSVHDVYQFSNLDKTSHFRLNLECLTYYSSNYKDFKSFLSFFMEGLFIISKILNMTMTQRFGLRFIDRLMINKDENIQQYLAVQEALLFDKLGNNCEYTFSEVKNLIKEVQLFNRVKVFRNGSLEFPSDIDPSGMVFKEKFISYVGASAVIDTDAFVRKNSKLSLELIKSNFDELHNYVVAAFNASVSDLAKKSE
jgi:uncharacterized protein (TIGR04255 family)